MTQVQRVNKCPSGNRSLEERLKSCDNAFREQLEAKQRSHDATMRQLSHRKDREIAEANERVRRGK